MPERYWMLLVAFLVLTAGWLWGEWVGHRLRKEKEAEEAAKLSSGCGRVVAVRSSSIPSIIAAATALLVASHAPAASDELSADDLAKLDDVIADSRRDEDRPRDAFQHPKETLEFFGVTPGMLVVEPMPADGWFTRVLLPYVTPDGGYAAVNYSVPMTEALSNGRLTEGGRNAATAWPESYLAEAAAYGPSNAPIEAVFLYGSIPDSIRGHADAVLYNRALHHLARAGELYNALVDTYDMLRPGGVVGVVQHATQAATPADYDVSGVLGYMREEDVIEAFESVGFVFEESSDLNANPLDPADHDGGAWTMPPTGRSQAWQGLGETNRMTLRFRKPGE